MGRVARSCLDLVVRNVNAGRIGVHPPIHGCRMGWEVLGGSKRRAKEGSITGGIGFGRWSETLCDTPRRRRVSHGPTRQAAGLPRRGSLLAHGSSDSASLQGGRGSAQTSHGCPVAKNKTITCLEGMLHSLAAITRSLIPLKGHFRHSLLGASERVSGTDGVTWSADKNNECLM